MNELSDFLKARRKQLGLTQEEFAEKAGVALTPILIIRLTGKKRSTI
jgi:transcriptional regulator with XRE-family HTH domain